MLSKAIKIIRTSLIVGAALMLGGCSFFDQSVVPYRLIAKKRASIQNNAQYRNGYDAGYDAARQELEKSLAGNVTEMEALPNYRHLIYQGGHSRTSGYHDPSTRHDLRRWPTVHFLSNRNHDREAGTFC